MCVCSMFVIGSLDNQKLVTRSSWGLHRRFIHVLAMIHWKESNFVGFCDEKFSGTVKLAACFVRIAHGEN